MARELSEGEIRAIDDSVARARRDYDRIRSQLRAKGNASPHVGSYLAGLALPSGPDADERELVAAAKEGDPRAREKR